MHGSLSFYELSFPTHLCPVAQRVPLSGARPPREAGAAFAAASRPLSVSLNLKGKKISSLCSYLLSLYGLSLFFFLLHTVLCALLPERNKGHSGAGQPNTKLLRRRHDRPLTERNNESHLWYEVILFSVTLRLLRGERQRRRTQRQERGQKKLNMKD